jgi:hypothetical protein
MQAFDAPLVPQTGEDGPTVSSRGVINASGAAKGSLAAFSSLSIPNKAPGFADDIDALMQETNPRGNTSSSSGSRAVAAASTVASQARQLDSVGPGAGSKRGRDEPMSYYDDLRGGGSDRGGSGGPSSAGYRDRDRDIDRDYDRNRDRDRDRGRDYRDRDSTAYPSSSGASQHRPTASFDTPQLYAIYDGRVSNLKEFGMFVELDGFRVCD